MQNLDRLFVLTGFIFVLVGMALGLMMSGRQDFTLGGLHAHLNLLGFVFMTLIGLIHHAWPKIRESGLAKVHYLLHTISVAVSMFLLYFVLSDPAVYGPKFGPFMDASLGATYLSVLLFVYLFWSKAKD